MVSDRSSREFRAFSAPLSSVMVAYVAAAESRVRGALWSPDLFRGMANTGPYRSRDGSFVWNRCGPSLRGEGTPMGRGRGEDVSGAGCTSLVAMSFRFVRLDSSGGEELVKRGLIKIQHQLINGRTDEVQVALRHR